MRWAWYGVPAHCRLAHDSVNRWIPDHPAASASIYIIPSIDTAGLFKAQRRIIASVRAQYGHLPCVILCARSHSDPYHFITRTAGAEPAGGALGGAALAGAARAVCPRAARRARRRVARGRTAGSGSRAGGEAATSRVGTGLGACKGLGVRLAAVPRGSVGAPGTWHCSTWQCGTWRHAAPADRTCDGITFTACTSTHRSHRHCMPQRSSPSAPYEHAVQGLVGVRLHPAPPCLCLGGMDGMRYNGTTVQRGTTDSSRQGAFGLRV